MCPTRGHCYAQEFDDRTALMRKQSVKEHVESAENILGDQEDGVVMA